LLWLEQNTDLQNQSLLDYGCGSGILAIAAAKLGCRPVVGTDIDPQAMVAARSNAEINHTQIQFVLPNENAPELAAQTKYDIVMANILANPLQVLAPALVNKIRPGGRIVLSGVLARQADEVIATYSQWLTLSIWQESEGWVCLHGQLKLDHLKTEDQVALTKPVTKSQKKILKLGLLALFLLVLLIFSEHLTRNVLLPKLATRIDGTSNPIAVTAFSFLQDIDQQICNALGCLNRPVSDFAAWRIVNVTLQAENATEALKIPAIESVLQVQIQNRLAISVLFPNLAIALTDAEENVIKTISFAPQEWLPTKWQDLHAPYLKQGAPAGEIFHAELTVQMPKNSAGYRVYVFYPQ
jgi:ribosomal protein L11 methyltransferase